jgi:tetratricopeptide (TPR) repeat protein
MTIRLDQGIMTLLLILALGTQPAAAQRGGRGGGGSGGRTGGSGGGGLQRGGGGLGGGGSRAGLGGRGSAGAGSSHRPSLSNLRPGQGPGLGGGTGGRPSSLPGGLGGGNRPSLGQPGAGGQAGAGNRPSLGNRPGAGDGTAGGNRPGLGNRPGIGDSRAGGNRPGLGNRPGTGDGPPGGNRPGLDNRPGIGARPGAPGGPTDPGNIRPFPPQNPGIGRTPPAYNNWRGPYGNYHRGWVNGFWHGYHANRNWGWNRFAVGAVVGVPAWAFGSSFYHWGFATFRNPFFIPIAVAQPIVIQQTLVGGPLQTINMSVAAFDYSQPLNTESTPPPAEVADPALAQFDAARQAFAVGDYAGALKLTDQALTVLPNDATLHEFRALVFFAVGKYDLAAGPLYAVLAVGPGWDWTTLAGLYPDIEIYTDQFRTLEAFVKNNPRSASGRFVLAYHYLTQGHMDEAVAQLKEVLVLEPTDTLSAQLMSQLSPAAPTSDTQATPPAQATTPAAARPGNLAGTWTARPAPDTTITLAISDDGTFAWKVSGPGQPQTLAGQWSLADDVLTLAQAGQAGALVGHVRWQADNSWGLRVIGASSEDQGLTFTR